MYLDVMVKVTRSCVVFKGRSLCRTDHLCSTDLSWSDPVRDDIYVPQKTFYK